MEYKMCVGNDGPYFCVLSPFEDIYQLDMFMDRLDKELPEHLCSLDLEAIGSLLTDMDVVKEVKPSFYVAHVLSILLRNCVVHFYGFGHSLSLDPVPFHIQCLLCSCKFSCIEVFLQDSGILEAVS